MFRALPPDLFLKRICGLIYYSHQVFIAFRVLEFPALQSLCPSSFYVFRPTYRLAPCRCSRIAYYHVSTQAYVSASSLSPTTIRAPYPTVPWLSCPLALSIFSFAYLGQQRLVCGSAHAQCPLRLLSVRVLIKASTIVFRELKPHLRLLSFEPLVIRLQVWG